MTHFLPVRELFVSPDAATALHAPTDAPVVIFAYAPAKGALAYLADTHGSNVSLSNAFHDNAVRVTKNPSTKRAAWFTAQVPAPTNGEGALYAALPKGDALVALDPHTGAWSPLVG